MNFSATDHTFSVCAYKSSEYLEDCIKSLLNQTVKSNIIITTSTPNETIKSIARKYNLKVTVNPKSSCIGDDWNFAYNKAESKLVTIAHQDDIYDSHYVETMLKHLNNSKFPIMYFSSYSEIRNGKIIKTNKLLKIKRIMLFPLKFFVFYNSKFIRRLILSFGSPICCPAVTMVKENFGDSPFLNDFYSDVDWQQWEIQSKKTGEFIYCSTPLMYHRIHKNSATSNTIYNNSRTKEDYIMFRKFWCKPIAKILTKVYSISQKFNEL